MKTQFTYDNAGNLLRDDKAKYTYDAFNRTEKVETSDGHVQINRYDAEGLRHEMEEDGRLVQFIFHGDEIAAEEKDSSVIRYIRGYDLIASDAESARTYYHYASDEMSSITHIVGENQILNHYEYDAWGNTTVCEETVGNRFRFNGQQYDPITQQYYLRARFYNPVIARFTQEDTYRGDGLNLYAYCANNPVYYEDPSGHMPSCIKEVYDRLLEEGYSKADAYRMAKDAYWEKQYKYSNKNPTVEIPDAQGMTRDQWKDAYREVRLKNRLDSNDANSGFIDYGRVDNLQRATGIKALITKSMLRTGSEPNRKLDIPGFQGGQYGYARGHLLAKVLGGSGKDPRNLVPLWQNPVNSPVMRDFELAVRDIVDSGQNVYYECTPIYSGNVLMPIGIEIHATGSKGFSLNVGILNKR